MNKALISIFSALYIGIVISPLCLTAATADSKTASSTDSTDDDAYQQTIIEFLLPQIDQAVHNYYKVYFHHPPGVAPYYGGKVLSIKHRDSEPAKNLSYSYEVVVQVMPYFGPHIVVGRDNLTFRVFAGGKAQLENYEHIESFEIPQHYRDTIIGKWPTE